MKYLKLHKLLWFLLVLVSIIVELMFVCISYLLYFVWNLKQPKVNLWYWFHNYESDWDGTTIEDYNPYHTFIRRYKIFNNII